jgi:Sugar phosphate permease
MTERKGIIGKYLFVVLAMCGFSCGAYGIVMNAAGVFFTPIAQEFNVGKGAVSMTLTIASISMALSGLLVPKLLKEKSLKVLFIAATALMALSTIAMAMSHSLFLLYIENGIRGFGAGLISYVTISIFVNHWFYAKHGLITSITMGFSGISGAILSPLFTALISSIGWRSTYLVSSVLFIVFILPAVLLPFTIKPENSGLKAYGIELRKESSVLQEQQPQGSAASFILVCAVAVSSNIVIGIVQHLPSFALSIGSTAEAGAFLLSLALIGNIASKLIAGTLADSLGTRNSLLIISGLFLLAVVLLLISKNLILLDLGALLLGCGYGIGAVGTTLMTKSLFGVEGFTHVYPTVAFVSSISYALATTGIGYLFDMTGSYALSIEICLVLCILLIVCILIAYRGRKD